MDLFIVIIIISVHVSRTSVFLTCIVRALNNLIATYTVDVNELFLFYYLIAPIRSRPTLFIFTSMLLSSGMLLHFFPYESISGTRYAPTGRFIKIVARYKERYHYREIEHVAIRSARFL